MTEAEIFTAFSNLAATYSTLFFGFVSLMSGFLIMSYLAANKLPMTLASIVLALFSMVSGSLIFRMNLTRNNIEALMSHVVEQKAMGNLDLPWFPLNPAGSAVAYLEIAATVGGFIGCIVFFFYQRKLGSDDT